MIKPGPCGLSGPSTGCFHTLPALLMGLNHHLHQCFYGKMCSKFQLQCQEHIVQLWQLKIPLCPSNFPVFLLNSRGRERDRETERQTGRMNQCERLAQNAGLLLSFARQPVSVSDRPSTVSPTPCQVAEPEIVQTLFITFLPLLSPVYSPTTDTGLIKGCGDYLNPSLDQDLTL